MAHIHDHGDDHNSYYVEQLCAVGVCGALGAIAVLWWSRDIFFLVPAFRLPVLIGGGVLLLLVAVRAVSLWILVGKARPVVAPAKDHQHHDHNHDHAHCDHDHDHANDHAHGDHDHDHHDHDHAHDHGHEHGVAPWRYTILLLPIVLFLLNLPNSGFSGLYGKNVNLDDLEPATGDAKDFGSMGFMEGLCSAAGLKSQETPIPVTFLELERASNAGEDKRAYYQGKLVKIKGQYFPGATSNRRFTVFRFWMVHCAADAIKIEVAVECGQDPNTGLRPNQWVDITGRVAFRRYRNNEILAVLMVPDANGIKPADREPNPFIY